MSEENETGKPRKVPHSPNLILLVAIMVLISFFLGMRLQQLIEQKNFPFAFINGRLVFLPTQAKETTNKGAPGEGIDLVRLQEEVLPAKGHLFKIKWEELGQKMVADGVIDKKKLAKAIAGTENLPEKLEKYFDGSKTSEIELNQENAQFWVDVLWGLGLSNKNEILDKGSMAEGQTANFASTGGYTIGVKDPMEIYSKFSYIPLSPAQQALVLEIAEGVYRPCCGNSTAFPDCNHGMAALALIELMVSQNFSKEEIYQTVLAFNSYWFPQTYLDISYHFTKNGKDYKKVPAAEILSKTFSSAMGYGALKKQIGNVEWPALKNFQGCGA